MSIHRPVTKISASFANLSDAKLFYKANHICESISSSDYYNTPKPGIKYLKEALTRFELSLKVAHIKTRINVFNKNEARKDLIGLLKELGHYVNYTAKGNLEMLASSGFDISKDDEVPEAKILPSLQSNTKAVTPAQVEKRAAAFGLSVLAGLALFA
jgi:hypothetical protein